MKKRTENEAKDLLETNAPPEGAKVKSTDFVFEVTVENNPQELRTIRPCFRAAREIPTLLPEEAQIVLRLLFDCFERQSRVAEGLIGDLIWGFQQCGFPAELTFNGLMQLEKYGYIRFQAKDGQFINHTSDKMESAWIRYEKKLKDLVYE